MLNEYMCLNDLSSGKFGKKQLVRSLVDGKLHVLLKVNLKYMNYSERQYVVTEVTILSRCRHKNIMRYKGAIYDHGKAMLSIFTEFTRFSDIRSRIELQNGIFFPEKLVLDWFVQISLGLQYIHSRNINHRDLTTRNIYFTSENWLKIGDFGIACIANHKQSFKKFPYNEPEPYNVSPEICRGEHYTSKSDIWALGCILFEMLALVHPFKGQTSFSLYEMVTNIKTGKRKELPSHCSLLSICLVDTMIRIYPEERLSIDEVLNISHLDPHINSYLKAARVLDTPSTSAPSYPKVKERTLNALPQYLNNIASLRRRTILGGMHNRLDSDSRYLVKKKNSNDFVSTESSAKRVSHYLLPGTVNAPESLLKGRPKKTETAKSASSNDSGNASVFELSCDETSLGQSSCSPSNLSSHEPSMSEYCLSPASNDGSTPDHYLSRSSWSRHDSFCQRLPVTGSYHKHCPKTPPLATYSPPNKESGYGGCLGCFTAKFRDSSEVLDVTSDFKSLEMSHPHNGCPLNILWMNRIRCSWSSPNRLDLIEKLETTLGKEKFNKLYSQFTKAWISDTPLPRSSHLNVEEQLCIPLIIQLIQIDVMQNRQL